MFLHGTRVRSSRDEEGQGGVVIVVRSRFEACVRPKERRCLSLEGGDVSDFAEKLIVGPLGD